MDLNENAFFDEIIYVEYKDSDNETEIVMEQGKSNKITVAQSKKLISTMDGRSDNIAKGKMKSDEETNKLLKEWDDLTIELNSLGPPTHSSSKLRRVWAKMKCRKRKRTESSLHNRGESKEDIGQTSNHIRPNSIVHDERIRSTVNPLELEPQQTTTIEQKLSQIERAIASFVEQQTLANDAMNKKLNILTMQQADMLVKLNLLAKAVGLQVENEETVTDDQS